MMFAITACAATESAHDEIGFVPLFDGQTLDGWRKVGGGATYHVEEGDIVGKRGPGPNTFLRTEKQYHDFILKLEFKLDIVGNSGVQFRSHQQNGDGRVFGYQCEIDPSDRRWSGGIYDESRRAWLYPLADQPEKQAAFKLDDWNEYVIKTDGPHLQTWVNGVRCADLLDVMDLSGFIALQVHGGKQGQIRWRNIRLKDLGQTSWRPLFDGKTLNGWSTKGGGDWRIDNGAIHGVISASQTKQGLLMTEQTYTDFAVRAKFKINQGDSGLYFRVAQADSDDGVAGVQAQLINDNEEVTGLYETAGRGWIVKPNAEIVKKHFKPDQWNEVTVIAIGSRIAVKLNGYQTVELLDDQQGRRDGRIALQLHSNQDMDVEFKDIEIIDLAK